MKYNRFLAIFLLLTILASLISCNHGHFGNKNHGDNGQNGDTEQPGGEGYVTFYYSVTAKTLHLADCYQVKEINEEYLKTTTDASSLLEKDGYKLCGICLGPPKAEEPDEDDTNKVAKEDATFVINKNQKTLHDLKCHWIKEIKEGNIQYTDLTLEEIIALDEYKPCSSCLPDEAEEYYKKHPELKK